MNKLILLNGTSSSGKTVIAKYLQKLLPEPYCLLSMDTFMEMGSKKYSFNEIIPPIIKSMMHSICVFLLNGNNVIADCVLYNPLEKINEINKLINIFNIENKIKIFKVKIFATKDVLIERELEREDRQIGIAESQIDIIHKDVKYDLEIDTSLIKPIKNVNTIIEYINNKCQNDT